MNTVSSLPHESSMRPVNRFGRMEWSGAFGDLGTLIPFVVAYVSLLHMSPFGLLFSFGSALVICGVRYRTPFPVQPMKAIGAVATTQAAQTATITAGSVYGADIATGLIWLILGLTGAARIISGWVPRTITVGIVLGLGIGFMLEGIRWMSGGWLIAGIGLAGTILLLTNKTLPAMFVLLIFGAACGAYQDPRVIHALWAAQVGIHLPRLALTAISWHDLFIGTVFLALPQVPLTLGNAIIAIREENNRLFPEASVTENEIAGSTGIMNLGSAVFGGVPMCHGAGGMAGHVAFGARTGGAPIILGTILIILAIFLSGSVEAIFALIARPVLGVIVFMTGAQLALGSCDFSKDKTERFITLVTAAFAVWNVGLAFIVGLVLHGMNQRGRLKL